MLAVRIEVLHPDVAFASPDAIPFSDGEYVYILNRFMHDYVSVYDPQDGFSLVAEHAIQSLSAASTNPHGLAFVGTGQALVSLYGASEIQVHDFLGAPGASLLGTVDTSMLADDDEVAEAEFAYVHQGRAWVLSHPVDRLDLTDLQPVGVWMTLGRNDLGHGEGRQFGGGVENRLDLQPGHGHGLGDLMDVRLGFEVVLQPGQGELHCAAGPATVGTAANCSRISLEPVKPTL